MKTSSKVLELSSVFAVPSECHGKLVTGVDLLSFNPYDTTDAQTALKVTQPASHAMHHT